MAEPRLSLGEDADEADWRALVGKGLKGAAWDTLAAKTSDGIPIAPLYREADTPTAADEAGFPNAAPFVRGARTGPWRIRQAYDHPDPLNANDEIIADLGGGVNAVELVIDPTGRQGLAIREARDFDLVLSQVMIDAAPVSLDNLAQPSPGWMSPAVEYLCERLKGASGAGVGFNLDPIGNMMRGGAASPDQREFQRHVSYLQETAPEAIALRMDARAVHEAGGTEAQEVATALSCGIEYLRWMDKELNVHDTASVMGFAISVGPDILVEVAKLRALRLCWARVLEASGAAPEYRAAPIQAFTSRRMMTRYDAETNILRVTAAAFAAAVGGADDITTYPFTDALGQSTPFSRRIARNTQLVLMEEARLGHVADPAGGAWFVERLTRDLAALAWQKMQAIEAQGGVVAALRSGALQREVAEARAKRQAAFARRKETITGVTDFPLLSSGGHGGAGSPSSRSAAASPVDGGGNLAAIRWAAPFEALREKAEGKTQGVFFANLGALAEFSPRALFAQNLFAVGGVGAVGADTAHASQEAMIGAFKASGASVAVIAGTDAAHAEHAQTVARALTNAGATWIVLAGKPGEHQAALREAGVGQFVFIGVDVLRELETLHAALGVA